MHGSFLVLRHAGRRIVAFLLAVSLPLMATQAGAQVKIGAVAPLTAARAQLGHLASAGAGAVVLWTHETEAALIVRQARQMGATFRFAGAALSQPTFLRLTGATSDGVISVDDFVSSNPAPAVQAFVARYKARYGAAPEIWAAAYDGNFHLAVLFDPADPAHRQRAEALAERVSLRAIRYGGTCTGEHGIGLHRIGQLEVEHPEGVELMRAIKYALDPNGVMNPGKVLRS
jgi:FAD/FMN-containing dehydrogenase